MRRYRRFFNKILAFFGISRPTRPQDIPKLLDKEALRHALEEARMLRQHYQVDVCDLAPGEEPGPPRPAGDFELPLRSDERPGG